MHLIFLFYFKFKLLYFKQYIQSLVDLFRYFFVTRDDFDFDWLFLIKLIWWDRPHPIFKKLYQTDSMKLKYVKSCSINHQILLYLTLLTLRFFSDYNFNFYISPYIRQGIAFLRKIFAILNKNKNKTIYVYFIEQKLFGYSPSPVPLNWNYILLLILHKKWLLWRFIRKNRYYTTER